MEPDNKDASRRVGQRTRALTNPPDREHEATRAVEQLMDALLGTTWRGDEDLAGTPGRVARYYLEVLTDPNGDANTATTFATRHDRSQMVAVSDIRAWSLCAHHLLPFSVNVTCAYVTHDRVLGLSKMPRMVQRAAHGLQTQEQLVTDVADQMATALNHDDVAVIADGQHLCVAIRGVRSNDATMHTSVQRGTFRSGQARQELMELVRRHT